MDLVLNWLWQGGVVVIVAAVTLRALDRTRADTRCFVCWAALLVIVLLPLASLAFAAAPDAPAAYPAAPIITVPVAWWTSSAMIAGAWAMWTTIHALRFVGAIVIVRRARTRCRPFPPALESSLSHWDRLRDDGRATSIVLSDRVSAAAVLGCGTPVIAVAPTLVARLDAAELDRVVVHEWAHVQRRDDLTNVGQWLVRAVAGWHPAIWWLDRRLSIERELACDETVVAVTGGAKSYASCLVKLAALRAGQAEVLLASGAISSGGLTRRVARLLFFKEFTSSAWGRRAAALVVVLLVALALGVARLRIVEAAVSATVVRVLQPVADAMPSALHPVAMRDGHPPSARRSTVAVVETFTTVPVPSAAQPIPERAAAGVDDPIAQSAADVPDAVVDTAPADSTLVAVRSSPPLLTAPPAMDAESRSAWSSAADAGVAIGRGSKRAGVATAGTFTRFAKRIADSF